jgi:hypothetical protein
MILEALAHIGPQHHRRKIQVVCCLFGLSFDKRIIIPALKEASAIRGFNFVFSTVTIFPVSRHTEAAQAFQCCFFQIHLL